MSKQWFCIDCHILMSWDNFGFWKCPHCGTEVWPPDSQPDDNEITKLMREKYKANLPNAEPLPLAGESVFGGGSKSGKKHKNDNKKKTQQKLYEQLYKQT